MGDVAAQMGTLARMSSARHGMAKRYTDHGMAWTGTDWDGPQRHSTARHGIARHGTAMARHHSGTASLWHGGCLPLGRIRSCGAGVC